jgi:lysophospholipase L1-like esterase
MKVVFFGDSLTWGGYGGDYVGVVRALVGGQHEIINAGVGGNTVVNLYRRYEQDVCAHEPDAVFIMVGGNDAVSYAQPATRPYYRKSMGIDDGFVSPDTFEQTYRNLITELQANYIETFIGLEPMESNATVVTTLRDYNARARDAARGYNVPVLDLFETFVPASLPERPNVNLHFIQQIAARERSGWNDWYGAQAEHGYTYTFDGVHWTPKAATLAAQQIVAFIGLS